MFKHAIVKSILVVLILAGAGGGPDAAQAAGGVKIGLSAPLTGEIVLNDTAENLKNNPLMQKAYLGVA